MRSFEELEEKWRDAPAPPRGRGTVELIVVRPESGQRESPQRAELSPQRGVHGDRWSKAESPRLDGQVTLMNANVAKIVADGLEIALFGDNFLVDLDLDKEYLPAGTRLRIGTAIIEITEYPHTGCKKFRKRFGVDALRWVNHKSRRSERLRGLHARVVSAGSVAVGDVVAVIGEAIDEAVGQDPGAQRIEGTGSPEARAADS